MTRSQDGPAGDELAQVFREEAALITGALTRSLRDFDLAEDAVQEALVRATARWPVEGIPREPAAWLTTVARHVAIDRLRRKRVEQSKLNLLPLRPPARPEDRLGLIFACCHPALAREAQLGLTLRAVCGFTNIQIAAALVSTEAAVTQRLARAKRKLAANAVALEIPAPEHLDGRLTEVLGVLYLMFNEGYLSGGKTSPDRRDIADDAAWLTALMTKLYPQTAEALGLLALMRFHQARRDTRFSESGTIVLLEDQDRRRWDQRIIAEGVATLRRAASLRQPGNYQLQAAITACHCEAASIETTDWLQIVALYDLLLRHNPSPVVRLNRAIALWKVLGPQPALTEVETLEPFLRGYHLYHATRGRLLLDLGERELSTAAHLKAQQLTTNPAEQALLARRLIDSACATTM